MSIVTLASLPSFSFFLYTYYYCLSITAMADGFWIKFEFKKKPAKNFKISRSFHRAVFPSLTTAGRWSNSGRLVFDLSVCLSVVPSFLTSMFRYFRRIVLPLSMHERHRCVLLARKSARWTLISDLHASFALDSTGFISMCLYGASQTFDRYHSLIIMSYGGRCNQFRLDMVIFSLMILYNWL